MSGPGMPYGAWLESLKASPHYLRLVAAIAGEYQPRIDRLERQVSDLLQEREDADHEARCEVECLAGERDRLREVARHVVAMADDAYLSGHPEWAEIVREARAALPGGAS